MEYEMPNRAKQATKNKSLGPLMALGKVPPQALDLEQAVLGALMLDQNALTNAIDILKEEFFYKPEHQKIFACIYSLFSDSYPVDMLTVTQELKKRAELELVGGAYYVAQLTNRIASAANIEFHARIIAQKYIQRELIRIGNEIVSEASDETADVLELLDKFESDLLTVGEKNFRSDYTDIKELIHQSIKEIEEVSKQEAGLSGVPSGFVELDKVTNGWQKGTLLILAARPAMGKTAFALSMARNIAVDFKKSVAFFSLEMSAVELVTRLISSESELSADKLKKGDLKSYEWDILTKKTQALAEAPLFIDDTPALTMFELRAKCRRLKQKHNISMVFLDYLQLMHGSNEYRGNREQEISQISRQLKSLSKELRIPILALSQLSRAVESRGNSKKPQLSDLRESGAIEQDADMVMFIYRPEYYKIYNDDNGSTDGKAYIQIEKHRSGPTAEVGLRFIQNFAKFDNYELMSAPLLLDTINPNTNFDSEASTVKIRGSKMNDSSFDDEPPFLTNYTENGDAAF